MEWRIIIFLCLFLHLSQVVLGQEPYIRAVNYPYQISTKTIYDMHADARGQIWLGTNKGLFRFNGKQAISVPFEESRQTDFTHLKTDPYGRIWGMNFANQLAYVNRDTLRLFQFPEELKLEGNLIDFDFTPQCIWLCSDKMIVAIHLKSRKILYQYKEESKQIFAIKAFKQKIHVLKMGEDMVCDEQGNTEVLPVCISSVGRFTVSNGEILLTHRENFLRKACIFKDNQWGKLPDFDLPESVVVYHLSTSKSGKTWICTKQGGWLWDCKAGKAYNLFPHLQVTDVVEDYQGNYWVSTLDDGLWFCPSLKTITYTPIIDLEEQNTFITRINLDDKPGHYWISAANGKTYYTQLKNPKSLFSIEGDFKKEITSFIKSPKTDEILNTSGIFNLKNKNYIRLPAPKDMSLYNTQYLLIARSSAAEWLLPFYEKGTASPKKVFGIELSSNQSSLFGYPTYLLRAQRSYSVCLDSVRQKYWVGYADDLYEYDFKGNFKIIKTQKGEPIAAHRMCLDKQGKLYVATFNQGLMVIKNQTIIKRLGKYNLLKSNEVRKVFNYKDTIWVGTTQEIGYLLNDNQSFVDVLGNNSIGRINYQDFIPSEQALLIAVGFKVLYLPRNILKNPQTLTVLYPKINQKENNIQIVLEMLNYTNPEYSRFYYRLENIDQKWQNTDDIIAFLRYSQLSPGDYVLEYYAEDKFSKLRSKLYKLNFKVKAAWWQQLWFYALIVCLIISFLTFIFYLWLKKAQKRQSLREQLWISQLKAIKAQMNPHFLYNILNTVQGLVYSNRRSEAAELLGKFSDLMRNTLESSEIPYLPLQDEINTIHLYLNLEQSRFEGKDFEYSVQAEEVWHLLDQEIPSMLIQPFVENAIKHGLLHKKEEKRLFIKFETHLNNLHISIEDNGIGRQHASEIRQRQAQRVQHFTMNATQQRIDLLNKMGKFKIHFEVIDLFDSQQVSAGTRVEINIIFLTPNKL